MKKYKFNRVVAQVSQTDALRCILKPSGFNARMGLLIAWKFHTTRPVPHHIDEKKVATSCPVPPLHQTSSVDNGISIEALHQLHRSTPVRSSSTEAPQQLHRQHAVAPRLHQQLVARKLEVLPTPPSIDLEAPTGTESTREGQQREGQQGEEHQGEEVTLKRKPFRPPSHVWSHFTKNETGDRCKCNYCKKEYACGSKSHGTSTLNRHLNECPSNPNRIVDKKQKKLGIEKKPEEEDDGLVKLKVLEFNQEECRIALAKMIIMDELPFIFVENPGFRGLVYLLQPEFQIPSRMTVYRDFLFTNKESKVVKNNELDKYLEDEVEFNYDGFDILKWWKSKAMKYRVISRIARDVFSIPISTVSRSQSAFSTGGRVLDPFRSSLNPTTVEALVCAKLVENF
ncbi:zinc finger BED domain-containing protein RICESLEEPER 2-like [Senna tora]|uniref:Zinc finger BED domain-containing protein RICESLEEPER 2-like n=1 Tax=Senna tora TaxID=362788 RepID=A0A834WTB4_9FABA|nr:zinc finger BED domain-containing protein RICESLEEPER 2-like [Senna tora]